MSPPCSPLILLLLIVLSALVVVSSAQETATTSKGHIIGRPTDAVCIQVVCPSADAASTTEPTCPDRCRDDCNIIQNACCENQVVAVCNDEGYSASGTVAPSSTSQSARHSSFYSSLAASTPAAATSSASASATNASSVNGGSTLAPSSSPTDSAARNIHYGKTHPLFAAAFALPVLGFLLRG